MTEETHVLTPGRAVDLVGKTARVDLSLAHGARLVAAAAQVAVAVAVPAEVAVRAGLEGAEVRAEMMTEAAVQHGKGIGPLKDMLPGVVAIDEIPPTLLLLRSDTRKLIHHKT